jgi:hypothetical protein
MIKLLLILIAICLYIKGECDTKWLGKSNKNWKMSLGLPICLLVWGHWWLMPITILAYVIAGSMGYGINNWFTKLVGEQNAIIGCGALLGLASFPIIGWLSILASILSGYVWYWLWKKDGVINEPWVAILRSLAALILLAI